MSEEPRRRSLGRGLSALLGDEREQPAERPARATATLPVEQLGPGRFQPRRHFDAGEIEALAQSIREKGVLQPLLVRRVGPDRYEIIAGERRWRAAQQARLHEVPVLVRELSDSDALEIALVENIQRQDLSALEEAEGYRRLMDEFRHTQDDLAKAVGKSRSHIANTLRLLTLPDEVKAMLEDGRLTAGHARALVAAADPARLAAEIVRRGLNVRAAEVLARGEAGKGGKSKAGNGAAKDADLLALEREMTAIVGLKVSIAHGTGGGAVTIAYRTLDQLDDVLRRLGKQL